MSRATFAVLATAAVLIASSLIPEPPRALQALTALAMLGGLGMVGDRLARRLCPGFDVLSHAVAALTFAVALAVVPATWMGQFGVLRPAPFLLWVAAALLLSRLVPVPARQGPGVPALASRRDEIERTLLLAAAGAVALAGLQLLYQYRWAPVGLGPDDESYHLAAVAVWHRFGDLRMIKFAVGDPSTSFYPVGGEVWAWVLLAPFRDSDALARFAQLPFALFSFAAVASIGRRLGLSLRSALLGALLFLSIRRVFPELALQAGNDHSASFFTLAAIDGALALTTRPAAGVAVYAGAALGLLLGTKYTGLLFGPVIVGLLILIALGERLRSAPEARLPLRALAGLAAVLTVAAAVAGGYTYLRNWATAGNPVFPAPVSLFGHPVFPGWEWTKVDPQSRDPEFQIDLRRFLLSRPDLLGPFFPWTLLPAALLAPLVALGRRQWRDALVLILPVIFFCQFLFQMFDHRDMRYFMPGVALAAVGFAWLLEQAGPRAAAPARVLLLFALTLHVTLSVGLGRVAGITVVAVLIGLGWAAVRQGPRLAVRPAPRRWLAAGATAAVAVAALPLGAAVTKYQAVKLEHRPPALALERLAGPDGAAVAYTGLNTPYPFFGSRLQNAVQIVPRSGNLDSQYYRWGGTVEPPFETAGYVRWRRRLERLGIEFVVVTRSPWENPERAWMAGRPEEFRLEYFDSGTEIWRVVKHSPR